MLKVILRRLGSPSGRGVVQLASLGLPLGLDYFLKYIISNTSSKTIQIPATGGPSRSKNQKDKNNEANQSATTANQRGKERKRKKLVETPPESDSDSDSNFIGQTKKKKTKKATKVEVPETSKPYTRRKTKKDELKLPKFKKPKKMVKKRKRHTLGSSYTNMNVFADLLTFLGQERFQQSCGIIEKQRMKMARSAKMKLLVRLLANLVDLG
ncbi:hypothetical protein H5410_037637 [Solanum commersonii]|uniref:Uncharacterized protein n=1 Tax=Solanum commersonii TaxID=4109 RepID=A0A9J5Y8F1_SOLCO|nr:hypothetical protein H5410_037637 [Solanum commersonii]